MNIIFGVPKARGILTLLDSIFKIIGASWAFKFSKFKDTEYFITFRVQV